MRVGCKNYVSLLSSSVNIPENFKVFYDELFTWPTTEHDNDTIVENDLF